MRSEYHAGGRGGGGSSPVIAQLGGPREVETALMEGRAPAFLIAQTDDSDTQAPP